MTLCCRFGRARGSPAAMAIRRKRRWAPNAQIGHTCRKKSQTRFPRQMTQDLLLGAGANGKIPELTTIDQWGRRVAVGRQIVEEKISAERRASGQNVYNSTAVFSLDYSRGGSDMSI